MNETQSFIGRNFYRISLSVKINLLELFHALQLKCAVHNSQQLHRAYRGWRVGWVRLFTLSHTCMHISTSESTNRRMHIPPPHKINAIHTTVLLYIHNLSNNIPRCHGNRGKIYHICKL